MAKVPPPDVLLRPLYSHYNRARYADFRYRHAPTAPQTTRLHACAPPTHHVHHVTHRSPHLACHYTTRRTPHPISCPLDSSTRCVLHSYQTLIDLHPHSPRSTASQSLELGPGPDPGAMLSPREGPRSNAARSALDAQSGLPSAAPLPPPTPGTTPEISTGAPPTKTLAGRVPRRACR